MAYASLYWSLLFCTALPLWSSCTCCFLQELEASYKASNPYHNSTHAADVVQGLATLFAQNSFMAQLTDLEMLSMILSCAMHDAGHPGQPANS